MSTTLEGINAQEYLVNWLSGLNSMYIADVKAIPDEKWGATFGGCTRSAGELTADTISLLEWVTGAIQGNTPGGDYGEYMTNLKNECGTKEGAIAKFTSACENFSQALS